ncbi:hypothetical protein J1N35_018987 [Gossypium stocksii]|uniref:Uncharacterized protein n=1 Tax=Gossypium stocksii TaxID=47602 RepID=A0A9D3VS18_9ROSI|nr:hypothetical protein J1N35_018987 [Gossypium stocksii]
MLKIGCKIGRGRYHLFNVNGELQLEVVIPLHVSSINDVMKLYIECAEADGFDPSSTTIAANVGINFEIESPIT